MMMSGPGSSVDEFADLLDEALLDDDYDDEDDCDEDDEE